MAVLDESALTTRLNLLRQSDAEAFLEELFEAYYQPLGVVIYRVVPDRAVVEDLLQDVFFGCGTGATRSRRLRRTVPTSAVWR